jgi:transaldolase
LDKIGTPEALALRGKIAIANAKLIYASFRELFYGARFAGLRMRRVNVQRVLWASTGTKNPAYSDVRYVEELIGPDTINTVPPATLQAFQEHGHVRGLTLEEGVQEAELVLRKLAALNIDLDAIAQQLQTDGVAAFGASLDKLLNTIQTEYRRMMHA